jgi:hypothetical protein
MKFSTAKIGSVIVLVQSFTNAWVPSATAVDPRHTITEPPPPTPVPTGKEWQTIKITLPDYLQAGFPYDNRKSLHIPLVAYSRHQKKTDTSIISSPLSQASKIQPCHLATVSSSPGRSLAWTILQLRSASPLNTHGLHST